MQLKFFTIPATCPELEERGLNNFLLTHRVLEVITNFTSTSSSIAWHICVKYITGTPEVGKVVKGKVDYKETLESEVFDLFSRLRAIRKQIATEEAIPAYAIFTDEELVRIAQSKEVNRKTMLSVSGIGEKRFEKYGVMLIDLFNKAKDDEAGRVPD